MAKDLYHGDGNSTLPAARAAAGTKTNKKGNPYGTQKKGPKLNTKKTTQKGWSK
jgi:hypothetical protein